MDPAYRATLEALRAPGGPPAERLRRASAQLGAVMAARGRPFALHQVTGSKGKSTTAYFLAQLLPRAMLFQSPHVFSARERLMPGARPVSERAFARHVGRFAGGGNGAFQSTFLGAMDLFAAREAELDSLVCEVGIGGWRDTTSRLNEHNALVREKTLIVGQVELEHCDVLGDTLYQIACDKARLTDARCGRVVLHHANRANAEVYQGVLDGLRAAGVDPARVHVPPPAGDVYRDCLALARAAAGVRGPVRILPYEPGAFWAPRPAPGAVRMLPARCTVVRRGGLLALVDGAHTPNSVAYALRRFEAEVRRAGRAALPTAVLFAQTRASRDYAGLLDQVVRRLGGPRLAVLAPPATFDLAHRPEDVAPGARALAEAVAAHAEARGLRVERLADFRALEAWLAGLAGVNLLALGSLHAAAAVLWALGAQGDGPQKAAPAAAVAPI